MGINRGRILRLLLNLVLVWFFTFRLAAQEVRIGLFDDQSAKTIVFHCVGGSYHAYGDSEFYREINIGELIYVSLMDGKLLLMDGELHWGAFNRLEIKEAASASNFRLKLVDPAWDPRQYPGSLEINLFHGTIQLINKLPLDEYLAGVVETESGSTAGSEFFKAQAILCRSYAIKNWDKHPGQNFNLCDNTHCQAYHGASEANPIIHDAVLATHGLVLADQSSSIVSAIFHSNSGGETQRASDVWNSGEEYLQAVLDPFSLGQRNAQWEKSISLSHWKEYLRQKCQSDISKLNDDQLLILQDHRKKFFILGNDSIRLADIRNDLMLRSAFFSMERLNDSILIRGKGYGHGVGMSQEGAMEMASQGFSASDILRFYFFNVQIIEIDDIPVSGLPDGFK